MPRAMIRGRIVSAVRDRPDDVAAASPVSIVGFHKRRWTGTETSRRVWPPPFLRALMRIVRLFVRRA